MESVIVELRAGEGGEDAKVFVTELLGAEFVTTLTCDRCGIKSVGKAVITVLKPAEKMPDKWLILTKQGELFITCPKCSPVIETPPPSKPPPLPRR